MHVLTAAAARPMRVVLAFLAATALLLAGTLVVAPAARAAGTATISGTVTFTGSAPEWAEVAILQYMSDPEEGDFWGMVTSDDVEPDGTYSVPGLDAGTYKVVFYAEGYVVEYWDDASSVEDATSIVLGDGETRAAVDAELSPGASISGTVTLPGPLPSYASVTAYRFYDDLGGEPGWEYEGYADIESDGTYSVAGLPAGTYKVEFDVEGTVREYWDDAATIDAATPIALTTDQVRTGVDATLTAGASISGTVTTPAADPDYAYAVAYRLGQDEETDEPYWAMVDLVSIANDGTYKFHALSAGAYKVEFAVDGMVSEFWDDAPTLDAATQINLVAEQARTGVDAALTLGASFSGRITAPAGISMEDLHLHAERVVGDTIETVTTTTPEEDGTYSLVGLPAGKYTLNVHDYEDDIPSQYYGGVSDWTNATTFTLATGQTRTGINHTVQSNATIDKVPSTTTLALAPGTRSYGTASTANITVSGPVQASGKVTIKDGTKVLGTATVSAGKASFALPKSLAVGAHKITAVYGGRSPLAASTSSARTLTVTKAKATITAKLAKAKIKKSARGKVLVTVKAPGFVPTGTVKVKKGSKVVGTATLVAGKVTVKLAKLKKGKHKLKVVYGGSPTTMAATSSTMKLTVKR